MTIALIAALALASAPAPASASVPLRGSGPWTVRVADNLCAMGRKFDGVGGPVMLVVKAPLLGDNYEITSVAPVKGKAGPLRGSVKILGAQADGAVPITFLAFNSSFSRRIVRFSIDGEQFKLRDAGPVLALDMGREGRQAFAVNGLPKALDKLEECTRGLRASFGIDQILVDSVAIKPKIDVVALFKTEDYPQEAMRNGEQGTVAVLGFVTPDGRFRDCKVIESSKSRSLDEVTCKIFVARARYTPAIGPDGRKIRYPDYNRITWIMPNS